MLKKLMISAAALCVAAPAALSTASAQEVGVSASIDYVSQYVFRGYGLAEGAIQPGVELSYGGLYGGVWYSAPVENDEFYLEETDFYVGYGFALSETISADVGVTAYTYSDDVDTTTEVYGGLSFDAPLAPSVYAYYDFDLEIFTLEGSGGYSWPLAEATSLDLGFAAGFAQGDDVDWQYASVGLAVSQAFSEFVSGYAGINAGVNSEDGFIDDIEMGEFESTGIWAGVGLSFSN
ncbi:TorF family putative porin [Aquisalinus flavus]|uniref:Outer membrane protein beta-barrel domain-containing protein n=1 Tax=Aquisalinus flavus TaxID=1526572 RepID=A0A8J2V7Q6_9PROT|nr:TorF family putative porin [Aquisalinus flavus]MBD0425702.1 hypothetical protein [Aquisalinus flavus]UNE48686.1 hypothetical protein FF099_11815 [Aquisalinus flavus]GGD13967.1 hypothetical protein GCM10011342_23390 [Aquisalinus flavus]